MADEKIRHIVRIANSDLKGEKPVVIGLTKIKGIGFMFSNVVCKIAQVDLRKKVGFLNENEIQKLNDVITNPTKYKIPVWLYNRRRDYDTGVDKHIISSDLEYTQENDVRRLQKIKSYRGLRHAAGLPMRGQRTRSNFRRNKGKAVGVKRKSGKSGRV